MALRDPRGYGAQRYVNDVTVSASGGVGGVVQGFTSTPTSGGTTVLTNTSTSVQYFTGDTTQTVQLPDATTLLQGWEITISNRSGPTSTNFVTVTTNGGIPVTLLPPNGGWAVFRCIDVTLGVAVESYAWSIESGVAQTTLENNQLAIGYGAGAEFSFDVAIGANAQTMTSGGSQVAIGSAATAAGNGCVAIGDRSYAAGLSSTCVGRFASCDVTNGVAIGYSIDTYLDHYSLGFGINSLSIDRGSLGVTVNNATYQLPLYSTLYLSTATAAGTTTLSATSAKMQRFSGTTTQTCVLPIAETLTVGFEVVVVNDSTGVVTVRTSGANTVATLAGRSAGVSRGGWGRFVCVDTTPGATGVSSWTYLPGATIL